MLVWLFGAGPSLAQRAVVGARRVWGPPLFFPLFEYRGDIVLSPLQGMHFFMP